MKIFLFGATGGTGRQIVMKLLEANYKVIALVIYADDLWDVTNRNLQIIEGNVFNPDTYQKELMDCNFVISALGTGISLKKTEIYSKGGQYIVDAMRRANVKRLITITGVIFDDINPEHKSFLIKYVVEPLLKNIYADMHIWENILDKTGDILWTCIRPSRLTNGRERGNFRVQVDHCPKGGAKISRKDLAGFIVKQIDNDKYVHQKVAIAY